VETLELLFHKGLLFSKDVLQKNEWNKSFRETFDSQGRFCSFLAQNSPKEAADLARNGLKLVAFTVFSCILVLVTLELRRHLGIA
jgi:hypothetical protein